MAQKRLKKVKKVKRTKRIKKVNPPPKSKEAQSRAKKRPGGSNVGEARKTSGPSEGPFVGPAGGAPAGSFPVTNRKQWQAAKAYARHAPNPSGIKAAADRVARSKGWLKEGEGGTKQASKKKVKRTKRTRRGGKRK